MDWLKEIDSYPRLDPLELGLPIPEREAAEAVARYNKAVGNLRNDSGDIAMIELKKLCATVPSFGQAFLLLGCCLMATGSPVAAERTFRRAEGVRLPTELSARLAAYYEAVAERLSQTDSREELEASRTADARASMLEVRSMNGLVRPSREKRRKVKMAKSRERRRVLKGAPGSSGVAEADLQTLEVPGSRPTLKASDKAVFRGRPTPRVSDRAFLRALLVLLAVAAVVAAAVFGVPAVIAAWPPASGATSTPAPSQDASVQLAWLLAQIDAMHEAGKPIPADLRALLEKFNEEFPDSAIAIPPDPTEPPVSVTPSPTGTPDSAVLLQASQDLSSAEVKIVDGDSIGAVELLQAVRAALAPIPGTTTSDGVAGTAADALARAATLYDAIERKACDAYRIQGEKLFSAKDYAGALVPYLKAYTMIPGFYNGGVAYYTGRCYEALGRNAEAADCYRYVIDHFPTRDIANYAKSHLDGLGQ